MSYNPEAQSKDKLVQENTLSICPGEPVGHPVLFLHVPRPFVQENCVLSICPGELVKWDPFAVRTVEQYPALIKVVSPENTQS
jgi:hypothetical protein